MCDVKLFYRNSIGRIYKIHNTGSHAILLVLYYKVYKVAVFFLIGKHSKAENGKEQSYASGTTEDTG